MTRALNKRVSRTAAGELPPLRGIIYARASKDRRGRSVSVKSQVSVGRRFFEQHNIAVVAVLVDNDMSASRYARAERQEYKEALRLLVTGEANLLWSWESARATRELDVFVELRRILIQVGGYFAYDERIYDMNDPDDRMDTAEDAVDAEKETEKLRKRVRRGVESRAYAGLHHGNDWYGHRKVYDQRTGEIAEIVADPEQGPVAKEAVTRLLGGENGTVIANDFNRRGISCPHEMKWISLHVEKLYHLSREPETWARVTERLSPEQLDAAVQALMWLKEKESPKTVARWLREGGYAHVFPGRWSGSKVRAVASNPALAGLRAHQGEVIGKGVWTGVITPAQHYRLKAMLGDPSRAGKKDGDRVKHVLSGVMLCDVCDVPVYGVVVDTTKNGRPITRRFYRCVEGGHVSRQKELTEAFVVEAVLARLERSDAAELFRVEVDALEDVTSALAEARELRARLDGFTDKAAEGELSAERLARIEAKLLPKIAAAESRARQIGIAPVVSGLVGPGAREAWMRLSIVQQREVLRAIVRPRLCRTTKKGPVFDPEGIRLVWLTDQPDMPELEQVG